MKATFFKNFVKRPNSTKRPTGGETKDVVLKQSTSIENPTFLIDGVDLTYNYVEWEGHYYYINDIILENNNIYELHCTQDLLATYKGDIQNGTAFIEYSTSYYNDKILDKRISSTGEVIRSKTAQSMENIFNRRGNYTLSTIGSSGVNRYQVQEVDLVTLGEYISSQTDDGVITALQKKYGSLAQCILGCTWTPYELNTSKYSLVTLGDLTTTIKGYWSDTQGITYKQGSYTLTIPWVNKDIARRKLEAIELYMPMFGSAQLNTSKYIGATAVVVDYVFDMFGSVTYTVHNPDGTRDYFTSNGGIDIPVAQFTTSPIITMAHWLGEHMQMAQNNPIGNDIGRALSGMAGANSIVGAIDACGTNASSAGGSGGGTLGISAANNPTLTLTNSCFGFTSSQESMANLNGRPLHATANLNTLQGYVQTVNACIELGGLADDRQKVNAMLDSGIFIE